VVGPAQIFVCVPRRQVKENIATAARGRLRAATRRYELQSAHMEMNDMHLTRNLGMTLLAIWLILYGLIALLGLSFSGLGVIMAILAIAAGVLILLGR